ncbi:type II secretion protein F [Nocardioides sp. dk4132]|uniref:type II secretion system F family protein n=1 Tax=unclassified Nocardioides TaxID=2615069 RepID=UPI001297167E|nr:MULTISPECIES: type II secretion system F family protein [unclassified Nocardioides]MQW76351.1 type II secretion protein F [Nocardioides sp. dk4132]QGA07370.1 type II secretion protein F [Nocardioides sp. dk884]
MSPTVLLPGLALATAMMLALRGYRLLRADPTDGLGLEELMVLRPEQRRSAKGEGPLGRLATRLAPSVRRRLPAPVMKWLQTQVDLAGRPDGLNVDGVIRLVLTWALMLSPVFLISLTSGNLLGLMLSLIAPVMMPLARLSRLRRLRTEALDRDLPDFLDVLAVTVTAGVGFRPALMRVSERFGGPLAAEMQLALSQVQHGASLRGAFEQLQERSDSEALGQFVTAFIQSDELGAPLVEALNQIAVDQRREHAQRQRRKAAQIAPRVTLVTTVVMVPAALILLLVGLILGADVNFGEVFGGFSG